MLIPGSDRIARLSGVGELDRSDFLTHLAGDAVEVRSAGSAPADTVNPAVIER